jgi:hypothetical protein
MPSLSHQGPARASAIFARLITEPTPQGEPSLLCSELKLSGEGRLLLALSGHRGRRLLRQLLTQSGHRSCSQEMLAAEKYTLLP